MNKEKMFKKRALPRSSQGDIYRDIEFIESAEEKNGVITFSKLVFPYVIVLTQDCDLSQDYMYRWSRKKTSNQDKWLLSVLVAPLYNFEDFRIGKHLNEMEMEMRPLSRSSTESQSIKNNTTPRLHYIEFPDEIPIVTSVIDFKHYFSVDVKYIRKVKKQKFVCRISELYREDISQRFSSFLSRIGLP